MNDHNNNDDKQKKDSSGGDLNYIFDGDKKHHNFYEYDNSEKEERYIGFKKREPLEDKGAVLYPQSKGTKNFIKIFISVTLAVMFFVAGYLTAYQIVPSEEEKLARWIKNTVERNYLDVEGGGVDFISNMGYGMIASLDKYSSFYYSDSLTKMEEENKGQYKDIGMHIEDNGDFVYIYKVQGNSPAYKAGIRVGDIFIKAKASQQEDTEQNYTLFEDMSVTEINNAITDILNEYGEADIVFERRYQNAQGEQQQEPYIFTAENLKPQNYSRIYSYYYDNTSDEMKDAGLDDNTAYITLEGFLYGSDNQFAENMAKFKQDNKTNLILDLRNNFGGGLNYLQNIASHLITDNTASDNVLLMNIELKNMPIMPEYTTANYYNSYNFNSIVVIANQNSASATEVLISAMKDYNTLTAQVGNSTYGKAVMQRLFEYNDTYAISITIGKIYYPLNKQISYNNIGLLPDEDCEIGFNFAGEYKYDQRLLKAVEIINNE